MQIVAHVKSEDSVAFANAIESFFKMPLSERDKMGNNKNLCM